MHIAGVDWSSRYYDIVLLDPHSESVDYKRCEHSQEGIEQAILWILNRTNADVTVVIEVPHGPFVEGIQSHGIPVYSIHPMMADRLREGLFLHTKDDYRDALALAQTFLNAETSSRSPFRIIQPLPTEIARLRACTRLDQEIGSQRTKAANKLWAILHRFYPGSLKVANNSTVRNPWLPRLIQFAPTPQAAASRSVEDWESWLGNNAPRFNGSVEDFRTLLGELGPITLGTEKSLEQTLPRYASRLEFLTKQRTEIHGIIRKQLNEIPENALIRSLPGAGIRVSAAIISEAWLFLQSNDYAGFRSYAGVAPVTRMSGKSRIVIRRRAYNYPLGQAMLTMASTASSRDERFAIYYRDLRDRGIRYNGALRRVADKMARILFAMLESGSEYSVEKSE